MIRFACPKCSSTIKAADNQAGMKFSCPKCKQRLEVPAPSTKKTAPAALTVPAPGPRQPAKSNAAALVSFQCPKCRAGLKAPQEKVGSISKCPKCSSPVQVPYLPPQEEPEPVLEVVEIEVVEENPFDFDSVEPPPRQQVLPTKPQGFWEEMWESFKEGMEQAETEAWRKENGGDINAVMRELKWRGYDVNEIGWDKIDYLAWQYVDAKKGKPDPDAVLDKLLDEKYPDKNPNRQREPKFAEMDREALKEELKESVEQAANRAVASLKPPPQAPAPLPARSYTPPPPAPVFTPSQPIDEECFSCRGIGHDGSPCSTCRGGRFASGSHHACSSCHGRGFKECASCSGTGRVRR